MHSFFLSIHSFLIQPLLSFQNEIFLISEFIPFTFSDLKILALVLSSLCFAVRVFLSCVCFLIELEHLESGFGFSSVYFNWYS